MPIKISISWAAGSWKSSVIKYFVENYWYKTADIGQIMRAKALKKWITINEYDKILEKHPEEDIKIDNQLKKIVQSSKKNIIVSRRMGFYLLPNIISIRLDVSPKEWAKRIFLQDRGKQEKKYKNIKEVIKANKERMKRLQKRLMKIYGVDFMDKKNYDKIIKTDGKSIEEIAQIIIQYVQNTKKNKKNF